MLPTSVGVIPETPLVSSRTCIQLSHRVTQFQTSPNNHQANILSKIHDDHFKNVTTRVSTRFSTRRFVVCLTMCHFVLVFFSPFSIAITSLGEERANLSAFSTFVRFVFVCICRFPLPLGVWEGLRFVIVALPGLFSYLFMASVGSNTRSPGQISLKPCSPSRGLQFCFNLQKTLPECLSRGYLSQV